MKTGILCMMQISRILYVCISAVFCVNTSTRYGTIEQKDINVLPLLNERLIGRFKIQADVLKNEVSINNVPLNQ